MRTSRFPLPWVFVSYAEEDFQEAEAFAKHLEDLARQASDGPVPRDWCYLAHRDNQGGDAWRRKVCDEARRRRVFVLLVSPASLASDWCLRREAWIAWQAGHLIVPVVLDGRRRRVLWNPATWRSRPRSWESARLECSRDPKFKEYCDQEGVPYQPGLGHVLSEYHGLPVCEHGPRLLAPIHENPLELRRRAARQLLETIEAEGVLEPAAVFRCDQHAIRTDLDTAWKEARGRALILFLFGAANHCPGEFWRVALQDVAVTHVPGGGLVDQPLAVELGPLACADEDAFRSRFHTQLKEGLRQTTSHANPGAFCFRWHVGGSAGQLDMDWIEVGIRGLARALVAVMDERFPVSSSRFSPPLVLAVLVESNIRIGQLVRTLGDCGSRVHAAVLPAFEAMHHDHVGAWARSPVGANEPSPSRKFEERAERLVSELNRDRSTLDFQRLKELCLQHHLIHAEL